jgi:hypothetical protein
MDAHLEVQAAAIVPLASRTTIGKVGTDVVIDDRTVSRLHASIEQVNGGWLIEDLGSRNGTFVNGDRIHASRAIHDGDEIRLGAVRVRFRDGITDDRSATSPLATAPPVSRRERDLLIALCRPLLVGSVIADPASVRELASELIVSESAVKKLLGRTYDRFGLEGDDRRRGRLAMEALSRGVVSVGDLIATAPTSTQPSTT